MTQPESGHPGQRCQGPGRTDDDQCTEPATYEITDGPEPIAVCQRHIKWALDKSREKT